MLLVPIASFDHRLKSVMMLEIKAGNIVKLMRDRFPHPLSREEDLDFDHISFEDNRFIACAMNRNETAHELSQKILKQCVITLLQEVKIISMFTHSWVGKYARCQRRNGSFAYIIMNFLIHCALLFLFLPSTKETHAMTVCDYIMTKWTIIYSSDGMALIWRCYVLWCISVWLFEMKNLIFGQQILT